MARVKSSVESKRGRGLCIGNTGLGETKVMRDGLNYIERDEDEAQKLERVRSWRAEGLTHRELVELCASEGIKTRRGTAPTLATIGVWVRDVELLTKSARRLKAKSNNGRGRKRGYRGQRAEDRDPALRVLLISYIKEGLSQAVMTSRLEDAGITNSKGKAYNKRQVQRFVSRIKREISLMSCAD